MGLIVQKFGGSSVRDRERLLRAMRIVRRTWEQGDDVVVVLSAQGDTTDALLARARELTEEPPPRELDALLATGETASVALGAIALASLGVPAVSLSGWQVPVGTDGTHGGANVRSVGAERIRQELAQRRVVLAAGFQGVDTAGDVTTLGRGGSDTSAVALAAFLGAERCIIRTWTAFIPPIRACARRRGGSPPSPATRCSALPRTARRCSMTVRSRWRQGTA